MAQNVKLVIYCQINMGQNVKFAIFCQINMGFEKSNKWYFVKLIWGLEYQVDRGKMSK